MEYENLYLKEIYIHDQHEATKAKSFLEYQGLRLDKSLEYIVGVYEEEKLIAIGGISGNTLRSIAVDPVYKGTGVINKLMSHLIQKQYYLGNTNLFIYTKPENVESFRHFGFKEITKIPSKVALLENKPNGIQHFIKAISKEKKEGQVISSLVMNCNPFTLGHQYLIEKASSESDYVHLFVVWEDKSLFPSDVRYRLVQEGIKDLKNVMIHKGKNYVISSATFPSYFIKDQEDVVHIHANLDLKIFGEYIVPALGIDKRYVGQEPYSRVTNIYNQQMKALLPAYGVEVVEIPRVKTKDKVISASRVRTLIKESRLEEIKELVPKTTYDFLSSEEGKRLIKNTSV